MKFFLADKNLKELLIITLLTKACIFLIIYLSFHLLPFCVNCWRLNFLYPPDQPLNLSSAFKTWDAQHYIYLAEKWYLPNQSNNAFFPLYPLLIKFTRFLFNGNTFITGLVLSNTFSLLGIITFYLFLKKIFNSTIAFRSTLLFLAFPASFYLSLIYTEALFLLLVFSLLYGLYQKKFILALISSILLPMTRDLGILTIIPLLIFLYLKNHGKKKKIFTTTKRLSLVTGTVTGFIVFLAMMKFFTGDYFPGLELHNKSFVGNYSIMHLLHPIQWFKGNFVTLKSTIHGFNTSLINRSFFIFFLFTLYFGYKKLDKTLLSYQLIMGLIAAMTGFFMSYPRFLLPVFPMFIALALTLKKKYYLLAVPMGVLQIFFLIMHSLNFWVA